MLTGTPNPADASRARRLVAEIWAFRQKIELEAADLFRQLAIDLSQIGAPPQLVALARRAAEEEDTHARLCREIVDAHDASVVSIAPTLGVRLGPAALDSARRVLYECVALCCVTETLSAALLLDLRQRVTNPMVKQVVYRIAKDEVGHSRLGWAFVELEAKRTDVSWLSRWVPEMLGEAIRSDVKPMTRQPSPRVDLSGYGILSPDEAEAVVNQTVAQVITPGLQRTGIAT